MAVRTGTSPNRPVPVALLVSVAVLALVAACGAPKYTYVKNAEDRTYLKIPTSWREIDQRELADAVGLDPALSDQERGLWLEGYDADGSPSALHLFGPHAPAPAALVSVRQVPPTSRGQLSLDWLRDLFFPVTSGARERAEGDPGSRFSDFALFTDQVLTPGGGLHGVHTIFRYRIGRAPLQTIDQTAYLNDDASKVYVLLVRCSTECYRQRRKEIGAVVSSFTIREGR